MVYPEVIDNLVNDYIKTKKARIQLFAFCSLKFFDIIRSCKSISKNVKASLEISSLEGKVGNGVIRKVVFGMEENISKSNNK